MPVIHIPVGGLAPAPVDQTAQPTSERAASGIAVEAAVAPVRTDVSALTVRVGALENEAPTLTAEIENA